MSPTARSSRDRTTAVRCARARRRSGRSRRTSPHRSARRGRDGTNQLRTPTPRTIASRPSFAGYRRAAAVVAAVVLSAVLVGFTAPALSGFENSTVVGPTGSGGSLVPPAGFLPDLSIIGNGTVLPIAPAHIEAFTVLLPSDGDVMGSFVASGTVTACLVNDTANGPFGSSADSYAPNPSPIAWPGDGCEWSTGATTGNSSFDAYVVDGSTTFVFFNSSPTSVATVEVTSDIYATFDGY